MSDINETRRKLIDKTRLRLEEWTRGERTDFLLETDSENRAFYPIVTYINEYLDEACNNVLTALPLHRLADVATDLDCSGFVVDKGIGYIPLPSDFIKLEGLQMKRWSRKCWSTLKVTDDEYKVQQYKHVRGISDKPQVAVAYGNLEIYSCCDTDTTDDILYAKYIPMMKAENTPERLWGLITCMCAARVEGVFGDDEAVQRLNNQLQTMMTLEQV